MARYAGPSRVQLRGPTLAPILGVPVDPAAFNQVTHEILGAAIEVHRTLGPGLLESTYLRCLQWELGARKQRFVTQRQIPLTYKGHRLDESYRVDLLVEDLVVVEVKAVVAMPPVFQAQTLTYMRLTECPAGLLINFNVPKLMDGVKRLINPRAK
jgi:GxxExxY protein